MFIGGFVFNSILFFISGLRGLSFIICNGSFLFDFLRRFDELKRRLEARETNPDPKEVMLRLNRFDYEESKISLYDYVLKNDNLEKILQIIMQIIESEYKSNM